MVSIALNRSQTKGRLEKPRRRSKKLMTTKISSQPIPPMAQRINSSHMLLRKSMTSSHKSIIIQRLLTTLLKTCHLFIQSSQAMSLLPIQQSRSHPMRRKGTDSQIWWSLLHSWVSCGHFTKVTSLFHAHQRDPTPSMDQFQDAITEVLIAMMTETIPLQEGEWWSCPASVPRKLADPNREHPLFRATLAALIAETSANKTLDHSLWPASRQANPRAFKWLAKVAPQLKLRIVRIQLK